LADGQPYSALHLVRELVEAELGESDEGRGKWDGCGGCAIIVARCCEALGRYSEGQAVLERAVQRGANLGMSGVTYSLFRALAQGRSNG
jgi:anaphase-promoting complex subunit 3